MKIKDGYVLRNVAGNYIVVPFGEKSLDFSGLITLNELGANIWNLLEKDTTLEEITQNLLKEYDVSEDVLTNDVKEFISQLKGANLIEN